MLLLAEQVLAIGVPKNDRARIPVRPPILLLRTGLIGGSLALDATECPPTILPTGSTSLLIKRLRGAKVTEQIANLLIGQVVEQALRHERRGAFRHFFDRFPPQGNILPIRAAEKTTRRMKPITIASPRPRPMQRTLPQGLCPGKQLG